MALKTLKGVKSIGGYPLVDSNEIPEESQDNHNFKEYLTTNPIVVDHDWNMIMFKLQSAPIQEVKISCMLPDFEHYLTLMQPEGIMWEEEALHQHAAKCIGENSQDWQDFCSLYGNDYTGVDGCQVDTLIHAALIMLTGLNIKVPCDENSEAIVYLMKALKALDDRKQERESRGVEGTPKE